MPGSFYILCTIRVTASEPCMNFYLDWKFEANGGGPSEGMVGVVGSNNSMHIFSHINLLSHQTSFGQCLKSKLFQTPTVKTLNLTLRPGTLSLLVNHPFFILKLVKKQ